MTEILFLLTTFFIIYVIYTLLKGDNKKSSKTKSSDKHGKKRSGEHQSKEKLFIRTHYDNLKVARDAPNSVIKAAYKALSQTFHPDKYQGSNEEAEKLMKNINASYLILIDPIKRAKHDTWIREQESRM